MLFSFYKPFGTEVPESLERVLVVPDPIGRENLSSININQINN